MNNLFGGKLRSLRKAKGLSQRELADAVGVDVMTVSKLERDVRGMRWETACALADALGVDVGVFRDAAEEEPATTP